MRASRGICADTSLAGAPRAFPTTCRSAVQALGSPDQRLRRRAHDLLVAAYWKPVYVYVRLKWRADNEEAKDLTQAFFAHVLAGAQLERYDSGRAAFRTYLRVCLDTFVQQERRAARRRKRGGGHLIQALDCDAAAAELTRESALSDPEAAFHRAWVRSLMELAVRNLRRSCPPERFQLFERYDLWDPAGGPRPTYAALAAEFGFTTVHVTNQLAAARRQLRALLLEQLHATTATDAEFTEAAAALFGADA